MSCLLPRSCTVEDAQSVAVKGFSRSQQSRHSTLLEPSFLSSLTLNPALIQAAESETLQCLYLIASSSYQRLRTPKYPSLRPLESNLEGE